MKPIKTDGDLVRAARRLRKLQFEMTNIIHEIADSNHPNAEAAAEDMYVQCWFAAWPDHVISNHLLQPDNWECGNYGIRHKGATKAIATRKHGGEAW